MCIFRIHASYRYYIDLHSAFHPTTCRHPFPPYCCQTILLNIYGHQAMSRFLSLLFNFQTTHHHIEIHQPNCKHLNLAFYHLNIVLHKCYHQTKSLFPTRVASHLSINPHILRHSRECKLRIR
jgi:hypothetical protein